MSAMDEILGIDWESPEAQLAVDLTREDAHLLAELVAARKEARLTPQDVARHLGQTVAQVQEFERYYADPTLGQIRRYALAIGAMVSHTVTARGAAESKG